MTARKRTTDKIEWIKQTFEEVQAVVQPLMNAAQIHKRASVLCMEKARPNYRVNFMDYALFYTVSFELILVSVEQSLRLLFLLFRLFPKKPDHDLLRLYEELQNGSAGEEGICKDIIQEVNAFAQTKNIRPISEDELIACLERRGSSYMDVKYFHVDAKGRPNWKRTPLPIEHDQEIFLCLAAALICLNMEEMEKRGFGFPLIWPLPELEMTERLKALKKRAERSNPLS